jgi:predicted transcriptional regulator
VVKKAKNPAQSEEEIINQAAFKCGAKFYHLVRKYTPKEYGEKVILKKVFSDKGLATTYLLFYSTSNPSDKLVISSEINRNLKQVMQVQENPEDNSEIYLDQREMTEVLKALEKVGVYYHITDKKWIKRHNLPKRGRGKTDDDTGGRPSAYKVTNQFENIIEVMKKPQACNRLRDILVNSGLAYQFEKFLVLSFFYALRKDMNLLQKVGKLVQSVTNTTDNESFKIFDMILVLDDNQLEQLASNYAEFLIKNRNYDGYFLATFLRL